MSYKKIEDINYLYENIDQSIPKEVEECVSLIVEELSSRGYSDNAIECFIETSDEVAISDLLNEKVKVSGDIVKQGPRIIQALKTFFKNRKLGNVVNQSKEVIKKNPLKTAGAVTGTSLVGSAALSDKDEKKSSNNNQGSTIRVPGIDKAEKVRTGGNNVSTFVSGKDNNTNTTSSSQQKDDQPSTAEIRAKNKEDGGTGMGNISSKEGNAKIDGKEINPNFGKETQVNKDAAQRKADLEKSKIEKGANEWGPGGQPKASKQIDAYQKGRPSPASFNTNQRQTRDLVKSQSKQVYPSITNKDLNQFSRSKKYTADDGKTQVDRSTVFTKAKFDFGNIKKGQELGVLTKSQRKQYDLKSASFKEEVAIDENRMASHTAGMSDAQKDAATSSVSRSTADKMGRRSDEAAFKGRKKKTSARYSSTGGKKRKNTTGRGQPEQYRKSADDDKNEARFPYGRSNIVQGKGSFKGLKKEDFDAFDIVLGYLQESGQVDSIDEALYIMMEMDAATIQGIVRDFENLYEEAADKEKDDRLVKYGIGHDGSDKKAGSGRRSGGKRPKGKTPLQKETEKKYGKGVSPLEVVKKKIEDEHGKGAIA